MKINNFDPFGNTDDVKNLEVNSGIGIKSIASAPWEDNASDKSNEKKKKPP
jgi:hypothetical protein